VEREISGGGEGNRHFGERYDEDGGSGGGVKRRGILRYAQNDKIGRKRPEGFFATLRMTAGSKGKRQARGQEGFFARLRMTDGSAKK
jgi:hypothetical protein